MFPFQTSDLPLQRIPVRIRLVRASELFRGEELTSTISPNPSLPPTPDLPNSRTKFKMKIKTSFQDVKTSDGTTMRVYIYEPNLPEYPQAKWPGVVCFSGQSGQELYAHLAYTGVL